jgi:uncharacterized protein
VLRIADINPTNRHPLNRSLDQSTLTSFFAAQESRSLSSVMRCWHADCIMRTPYAPAPLPRERVGRAAVERTFKALFDTSTAIHLPQLRIIQTEERHLWIALWQVDIHLTTGARYHGSDICMLLLQDGLIKEYTEYFDPIAFAQAYGV